ncbi:hypothetical protein D3C87_278460 [compost metagenome]
MATLDLVGKQKKLAGWAKLALFALVALVVAPIVFMIIKGIVGLAICAGLILLATWGAPLVADQFANWKLDIIKGMASRAPIETMQNIFRERTEKIGEAIETFKEFSAEVSMFRSQVESLVRKYPDQRPKYEGIIGKMVEVLEMRRSGIARAKAALAEYGGEIEKADAVWNVSQAAMKLNKKMKMTDNDIINEIKSKTAIDSVERSLNMAMADLDTAMLMEAPALDFNPSPSLNTIDIKEAVRV